MSYTEGKLNVRGKWIDDASGGAVAGTCVLDKPDEESRRNARRLVACWNALEGIDDPALWVAQMKFIDSDHTISVGIIKELQQERDELVKALRHFATDAVEHDIGGADVVVTTCESLESAKTILARYQEGKS